MSDSKVVRLTDESHARLVRLAKRTGLSHTEVITRALDHAEGKCSTCGQRLGSAPPVVGDGEPKGGGDE
jgi:hypothetical protein